VIESAATMMSEKSFIELLLLDPTPHALVAYAS
jgi:hypothetical protein